MKIRNKLLLVFVVLFMLFGGMIGFTLNKGTEALLKSTGKNSNTVGLEILKKIEQNIQTRLEQLQLYGLHNEIHQTLHKSNQQFASLKDRHTFIDKFEQEWRNTPLNISSAIMGEILKTQLSYDLRKHFFYFYEMILGNKRFSEVFATNSYGVVIGATNRTSNYSQSEEKWWLEAKRNGSYIGSIEYDESSNTQGIPLAVRVNDAKGKFLGVIKAVIGLRELIRTAEIVFDDFQTTELTIISKEGTILYYSKALPVGRNISQEPYFHHLENEEKIFLANDQSGATRLYTYIQPSGLLGTSLLNWKVLVSHDRKEILATSLALKRKIIFTGVVTAIFILFIFFRINRMISTPLSLLEKASKAIGSGNLTHKIEYSSHDEFGSLATSFNMMTSSLATSYTDLENQVEKRKRLEERILTRTKKLVLLTKDLERRNDELDEFTYIASHDLQEPLRKLTAFSSLLKRDIGENLSDSAQTDLHFITDAALRMQTLIQDLLSLSRSGRREMDTEPIDLNSCVEDALHTLSQRIHEHSAEIKKDQLPMVNGDKTLITQLYQNLISNGLKFKAEEEPKIYISVNTKDDYFELGVHDNGIGIKADYQQQIFKPFKKLHGKAEYEGSGIGLSICKKVVERHGGTIQVVSEPGKGSSFIFTLPQTTQT